MWNLQLNRISHKSALVCYKRVIFNHSHSFVIFPYSYCSDLLIFFASIMFHCVDIRGHSRSHSRRGSMDVLDEDLPVMKCFSAFQQSVISYRWWWSTQAKAYWRQRRKTMRLRYENREIIVHCSLKVEICGHNLQSAAPRFFFYFCGAMGGKPCFSAGMGSLFFLRKQNVQ